MSGQRCLAILLLAVFITSCDRYMPSGFWLSYHNNEIVEKTSDQGPWGGTRSLFWKASENQPFSSQDALQYAIKNSWQLVDSATANSKIANYGLPRWIKGDQKVFKFKTGWILIEPGSDSALPAYGYLVFNEAKTQMAVYHQWGE